MKSAIRSLLKARKKWEKDIQIYNEFLKGNIETLDGKYGAQEYISLAKNRIEAIDLKIQKLI